MTTGDIVADTPCERCGYDLRGLKGEGQCPECGFLIHLSIESWKAQQSRVDIAASDPRWIGNVNEGFVLALLTFILMMLLSFGVLYRSGWIFEWKSQQRRWTLGVACTMLVLSWAAAWKLSVPEKRSTGKGRRVRAALRISSTLYMSLPFIWWFAPRYNAGLGWIVIAILGAFAGWVATIAWFVYAGQLARRAGGVTLPMEARLLVVLAVIVFFIALMPELDAPEDSLNGLYRTHLLQFGPTEATYDLINSASQGRVDPPTIVGVLLPVWSAIFSVRMYLLLRRARRAVSSVSPGA